LSAVGFRNLVHLYALARVIIACVGRGEGFGKNGKYLALRHLE
jgi:hypothetical protein